MNASQKLGEAVMVIAAIMHDANAKELTVDLPEFFLAKQMEITFHGRKQAFNLTEKLKIGVKPLDNPQSVVVPSAPQQVIEAT